MASRTRPIVACTLFFAATLLFGCENENGGVTLKGILDTMTPAATLGNTSGPPGGPGYTNAPLDPSAFRIVLRRAALLKVGEAYSAASSYHIFDAAAPTLQRLTELTTLESRILARNANDPPQGNYDRVLLEVAYYESEVTILNGLFPELFPRRFRVYLADQTDAIGITTIIFKLDIKMEDSPRSGSFAWIDRQVGLTPTLPGFRPSRSSIVEANVHKLPPTELTPGGAVLSSGLITVTLSFPAVTVPSDLTQPFVIDLKFGVKNLFFFDDTNTNGVFDPFQSCTSSTLTCDGWLDNPSKPDPTKGPADFYPGLPALTVTSAAIQPP